MTKGREVTLHRTLASQRQTYRYRIVIEGSAEAAGASELKQERLDEIFDAASTITGATDLYVTTLRASPNGRGTHKDARPKIIARGTRKAAKRDGRKMTTAKWLQLGQAHRNHYKWSAERLQNFYIKHSVADAAKAAGMWPTA